MNKSDINNFSKLVESLRQYQRYELVDDRNRDMLNDLYVDPLNNNAILDLAMKENTTVLVGRKGTGKSTVFMRMQNELRKSDDKLSCYIDVKDVFDKAKSDYSTISYIGIKGKKQVELYSLQRKFILDFVNELVKEIEKSYVKWNDHIYARFGRSKPFNAIESLNGIKERINNNEHLKKIEIEAVQEISITESMGNNEEEKINLDAKVSAEKSSIGGKATVSSGAAYEQANTLMREEEKIYNRVFAKIFDLTSIFDEIQSVLLESGIRKLFVVLDDYSEIDQISLRMFCNLIVNKLNNNSDNFYKLKISAYPGRVELGELDPQKIDIRYLDYYQLYNYYKRDDMETAAIDYTKRIVNNRLEVYTNREFGYFFDLVNHKEDEYYTLLFSMSLNVIRHLGLILDYAKDFSISGGRKITKNDLEDAAGKFYRERLEMVFKEAKLTHRTYDERIDSFHLEELLRTIVTQAKEVKTKITTGKYTARIFDDVRKNPHVSHFHIDEGYENLVASLELNFFISKYNEMVSKKKTKVSIYAINYGLCTIENIRWGKPDSNKHRTYFIESPFNYDQAIKSFVEGTQKVVCSSCGTTYTTEQLGLLKSFGMNCLNCGGKGTVEVHKLSDQFVDTIKEIENNKGLIDKIEYQVLSEIKLANKILSASDLARELDTSYQRIGWVAKKIREKYGFLERRYPYGKTGYILTQEGIDFLS